MTEIVPKSSEPYLISVIKNVRNIKFQASDWSGQRFIKRSSILKTIPTVK